MTSEPPLIRSLLFVPANKLAWIDKAVASGADGVIFDLEDAVAESDRAQARADLSAWLKSPNSAPGTNLFVRINPTTTPAALSDLQATVLPRLSGVMIPKVTGPEDVVVADRVIGWLESDRGIAGGSVRIIPVMETAPAIRDAFAIGRASSRVAYLGGLGVKGGDVERAIGYRWSAEGAESLMMRSSVLLDARAAGVPNPLTGLWSDTTDLEGLRAFCERSRDLGYEGMLAIHPSHVAVINEVFTPSEAELQRDLALVEAMESAASQGHGATTFDGDMIDEAMAATARARLARYAPHHA